MLRIIVSPEAGTRQDAPSSAGRPVRFTATTEAGDLLCVSDQPLADSARILLQRGCDLAALVTMRHAGKSYDSFAPMPIGDWAKLTYGEGAKMALQKRRWEAAPDSVSLNRERSKVEVEAQAGTPAPD